MKKHLTVFLSAIMVFAMLLAGCGSEEAPETTAVTTAATTAVTDANTDAQPLAPPPLTLIDWSMHATTWSSPNGATVHITATPNHFVDGQKADFVVRLESDSIYSTPCRWDGTSYTASIDLNAANGYCYYVVLTAADGTTSEVAVNIPAKPTNEALINLEASLESSCYLFIEESSFDSGVLTLTSGRAEIRPPMIASDKNAIICQEAVLILNVMDKEVIRTALEIPAVNENGIYEIPISDITFEIPEEEEQDDISLVLNVTLSNGHVLSFVGSRWVRHEVDILPVVG